MKVLIFNGTLNKASDTSQEIANYLKEYLLQLGATPVIFNLSEYDIPFFEEDFSEVPDSVTKMLQVFKEYDRHIWLSPLYHGGMVGAMKNCLDWLILSSNDENPYLTHKIIAVICWGYGANASTGIDSLRNIVATLRAWALPYSVPIAREYLYEEERFSIIYEEKFQRISEILLRSQITVV